MYEITRKYITNKLARPKTKRKHTLFLVAHDTGNSGASAENHHKYFQNITFQASAHTFIDDQQILEIIPAEEKAWHVQYQKPIDNRMFGDDSNDASVGVELCYGGRINFQEAYKRFVWYMAYLCHKYKLDPKKHIVAHSALDPGRKTDPDKNSFKQYGITWDQFLKDVEVAYINQGAKEAGEIMSELNKPMVLNSREWSDIEKTYAMYRSNGILSSDMWQKLAAQKKLTYAQNIYLTTTCQGRFIEHYILKNK